MLEFYFDDKELGSSPSSISVNFKVILPVIFPVLLLCTLKHSAAEEWAEQLDYAENNGISPSDWEKQLNRVDKDIESVINVNHRNSQVKVVNGLDRD